MPQVCQLRLHRAHQVPQQQEEQQPRSRQAPCKSKGGARSCCPSCSRCHGSLIPKIPTPKRVFQPIQAQLASKCLPGNAVHFERRIPTIRQGSVIRRPHVLAQTIPMLVGMLASGRPNQGAGAPGQAQAPTPGEAAAHQQQQQQQQWQQHLQHQWQQQQQQTSFGPTQSHASFSLPPFMTGMGANQVGHP